MPNPSRKSVALFQGKTTMQEIKEITQLLDEGELDMWEGAKRLLDLNVPPKTIANTIGIHNWLWIKAIMERVNQ